MIGKINIQTGASFWIWINFEYYIYIYYLSFLLQRYRGLKFHSLFLQFIFFFFFFSARWSVISSMYLIVLTSYIFVTLLNYICILSHLLSEKGVFLPMCGFTFILLLLQFFLILDIAASFPRPKSFIVFVKRVVSQVFFNPHCTVKSIYKKMAKQTLNLLR